MRKKKFKNYIKLIAYVPALIIIFIWSNACEVPQTQAVKMLKKCEEENRRLNELIIELTEQKDSTLLD